jgi:hypothetical protein
METVSKAALCGVAVLAAIKVMVDRRVWRTGVASRGRAETREKVARMR